MSAPDLDQLDQLRAEPERTCEWCMARPGEWCENDCANPDRRCHPSYVAAFAAERGAYSDADAALIVSAVNALPALVAEVRRLRATVAAVQVLADELDRDADRVATENRGGNLGQQWAARNWADNRRAEADRLRAVVATAQETADLDPEWVRCPACRAMCPPTAWCCDRCGEGFDAQEAAQ